MEYEAVRHNFPPLYDARSRVLLLGSMPSPKSREQGFFYAHPYNRFWRVLAAVLGEDVPEGIEAKRALCLRRGVALWDVLASCEIRGAGDSSIRNPVPNDLSPIFAAAEIRAVFTTGGTAYTLYHRLSEPRTGVPARRLPSTSPANAAFSIGRLTDAYRAITPFLEARANAPF